MKWIAPFCHTNSCSNVISVIRFCRSNIQLHTAAHGGSGCFYNCKLEHIVMLRANSKLPDYLHAIILNDVLYSYAENKLLCSAYKIRQFTLWLPKHNQHEIISSRNINKLCKFCSILYPIMQPMNINAIVQVMQ